MNAPLAAEVFRTVPLAGQCLAKLPPLELRAGPVPDPAPASILVDAAHRFQTHLGFGGAFTEAAASVFGKLSVENQAAFLRAYFDLDPAVGHGYTLGRTHIQSCDFALGNYAYTETPGDTELRDFSIARDRQALIPLIQAAAATAGRPLQLFASPWSPPAWMKTNGQMNNGGKLRPEHRAAWALLYARYLRAYADEGIPIWGLTVQNEPAATQTWDSCVYSPEEERDFVRDHLGPTLAREGYGDVKLIVWDHNRDGLFERAKTVYDDPEAAKYVWGAGFHWYVGDFFDNVQRTHDCWPEKHLLFTEGCQEGGPHLDSLVPAERYARSIIADLNRWTVGWCDWNLLLDERGGPNHVGNFCSAPILADTRLAGGRLLFQPSYYYLGQFARFIRPGARRVAAASTLDELETTAFVNPDGRVAVVVLNRTDKELPFVLKNAGGQALTEAPARSLTTFVLAAQPL